MRFNMRSTMLAMAVLTLAFAAPRIGIFPVITACICLLAWRRTSDGIVRGLATSTWQKATLFLTSTTVAAVIIGLSDLAFLVGYEVCTASDVPWLISRWSPTSGFDWVVMPSLAGLIPSLCVATLLRKTIWPIKRAVPRPRVTTQAVPMSSLIGLIGVACSVVYVAWVAVLVLLRAWFLPFDGVPLSELVYGPAITVGSSFLLIVVGLWAERGRSSPDS